MQSLALKAGTTQAAQTQDRPLIHHATVKGSLAQCPAVCKMQEEIQDLLSLRYHVQALWYQVFSPSFFMNALMSGLAAEHEKQSDISHFLSTFVVGLYKSQISKPR